MSRKNGQGSISHHEIMREAAISKIKKDIEDDSTTLASLRGEFDNIRTKVLSSPFFIHVGNISLTAVKYDELLKQKKELSEGLDNLGIIKGIHKLSIYFIEACIAVFFTAGVIYRMLGERAITESIPPILETLTLNHYNFAPLTNGLFIEGLAVIISFFIFFHAFGNNYKNDGTKTLRYFTIISGILIPLLFVFYVFLF